MPMQRGAQMLWIICTGFLAGVFAYTLVPVGFASLAFCMIVVLAAASVLVIEKKSGTALVVCVFASAALLGAWRTDAVRLVGEPYLDAHVGATVVLEGTVGAEPDVREGSVRLSVQTHRVASTSEPVRAGVLAVLPAYVHVAYGDTVRVRGVVALPEAFDTAAGRQFDYPGYLAVSGIGYQLERASVEVLEPAHPTFTGVAIALKQWYVRGLGAALVEPQAGLAAGITAGDKRGLGDEVAEEFRTVSLTHIIVLSGYNISVVADAVMRVLSWAPPFVRFGAAGSVALFFAVMTGGAAASVRAAVMALIAMTAKVSGRYYRADRALAVVAAGMAAWNPLVVVYDPGYQLSLAATAGLIWLSPIVEQWCTRIPAAWGLRAVIVSTVSAQIAVAPLILYSSGLLSFAALPANVLILAGIPLAMFWSLIAGLAGSVLGILAPVFALPAHILLSYVLGIAHVLANLPFASVTIPAFSPALVVLAYLGGIVWVRTYSPIETAAPLGAAVPKFFVDAA